MNLMQLTRRLKNPRAEYWQDVSEQEMQGMRNMVANSFYAKYENHILWAVFIISLSITLWLSYSRILSLWAVDPFMALANAVWAVCLCVLFLYGFIWGLVALQAIIGESYLCEKMLKSIEDDPILCAECVDLTKNSEVDKYRLAILKKGRKLAAVDVEIMRQIHKTELKRSATAEHRLAYERLHKV